MAASCTTVPSYIIHHVFSFFKLQTQLTTLSLVCKAWHHACLCMNCITTNTSEQELKLWFIQFFDPEIVDLLVFNFKAVVGTPPSYVVRNLVFRVLRDIQECIPHLEGEIINIYSQLEDAEERSDKLLKVYQASALLYLLKKLESTFDIYDLFTNIPMALGEVKLPVCKREGLKALVHVGALLKFRFDGNPAHICDQEFHMRAAIKCFDVKLLIKKKIEWLPVLELVEAAIGTKFLHPSSVFQNFEEKLVEICKKDFADFNELLALMEDDSIETDSTEFVENEEDDTHTPLTTQTNFPLITNDLLAQYMTLAPTESCDRHHTKVESPLLLNINLNNDSSNDSSDFNLDSNNNNNNNNNPGNFNKGGNDNASSSNDSNKNNTGSNNDGKPSNDNNGSGSGSGELGGESRSAPNTTLTTTQTTTSINTGASNPLNPSSNSNLIPNPNPSPNLNPKISTPPNPTHVNESNLLLRCDPSLENEKLPPPVISKRNAGVVEDYKFFFDEDNSYEDEDDISEDMEEDYEEFEYDDKENVEPPAKVIKMTEVHHGNA